VFIFNETVRPEATAAIAACRELGCDVGVLTGDDPARGRLLEVQLGVRVQSGLLPEDKLAAIHEARRAFGPVAMIGDGVNDAPALAASDVGIALGCGTDLARESAPIALLADNLGDVPWAVGLARRSVRVMRQNLFWAFAYNSAGIALAATGWLNPAWAAVAMVASSLLVVGNSLRLQSTAVDASDSIANSDWPTRAQHDDLTQLAQAELTPAGAR
jgi:P-type E1-E2 ATPase